MQATVDSGCVAHDHMETILLLRHSPSSQAAEPDRTTFGCVLSVAMSVECAHQPAPPVGTLLGPFRPLRAPGSVLARILLGHSQVRFGVVWPFQAVALTPRCPPLSGTFLDETSTSTGTMVPYFSGNFIQMSAIILRSLVGLSRCTS